MPSGSRRRPYETSSPPPELGTGAYLDPSVRHAEDWPGPGGQLQPGRGDRDRAPNLFIRRICSAGTLGHCKRPLIECQWCHPTISPRFSASAVCRIRTDARFHGGFCRDPRRLIVTMSRRHTPSVNYDEPRGTKIGSPSTIRLPSAAAGADPAVEIGFPGLFPFTRGIQPTMYRGRLWTMRQCGVRVSDGIQSTLQCFAGTGGQRPERGLRSADADRVRLRSRARRGRGRTGRRRHRHGRGHGGAVRWDPARSRVDVDDHQCDGDRAAVAVCRRREAPGRAALVDLGHRAERHPQGVRRARHGIFPPASLGSSPHFAFCDHELPNWNTISISGYHIREAGSTAVRRSRSPSLTRSRAAAIDAGLDVNRFGQRLSFFFNAHNDFLEEVAKFRAARRLWAHLMRDPSARRTRASSCASHATAGSADRPAARQQHRPRGTSALAAVLGGTQSLRCNGRDEALARRPRIRAAGASNSR